MHAAIRRDRVADPIRRAELAQRIGAGALPDLQRIGGFAAGFVVVLGGDEVICLGIFADGAGAAEAADHLRAWGPRHVAELLGGPGDVATTGSWVESDASPTD